MKRWAWLVAFLYLVALAALFLPLVLAALWDDYAGVHDVAQAYLQAPFWAVMVGLSLLMAGFLLLVPVALARGRPVSRGRWVGLAAIAGLMMGVVVAGLALALRETILGGYGPDDDMWLWFLALGGAAWLAWGILFGCYRYSADPRGALRRVLDRLLAGSIAELLVAVPCHVYVRHRHDCCAGYETALGLATGAGVMLFAFGPGVFFLLAERAARLRRAAKPPGPAEMHARDALQWSGISLALLVSAAVWATVGGPTTDPICLNAHVAALVTAGAALLHAGRAWRADGRLARVVCAFGLLAAECVVVLGAERFLT